MTLSKVFWTLRDGVKNTIMDHAWIRSEDVFGPMARRLVLEHSFVYILAVTARSSQVLPP